MGMFTEEPLFDDPSLPVGWHRKVVQRKTGATAGAWDVYVYNPEGKKFRSRNELRTFFHQTGSKMNSEDFDFSVKGKGHHNKDGMPDGLQMMKQPEMSTREQGEQKTITMCVCVFKMFTTAKHIKKNNYSLRRTVCIFSLFPLLNILRFQK